MAKIENLTAKKLQEALDKVDNKKPTQRLMLAILYKQGPSVPMIADWFDMREETIYRWFSEMEEKPLMNAIFDEPRPGRNPKLSADQRKKFEIVLSKPPNGSDFDASVWTPKLAQKYLREEFDIEYSRRHVQRIMKDLEPYEQPPEPQPTAGGDKETN